MTLQQLATAILRRAYVIKNYQGKSPKLCIYISTDLYYDLLSEATKWNSQVTCPYDDGKLAGYPVFIVSDPRHPEFVIGEIPNE